MYPWRAGDVCAVKEGGDDVEFEWMGDKRRKMSAEASMGGFPVGVGWQEAVMVRDCNIKKI